MLPRMADFAKWAAAALGDEGSAFLAAYKAKMDNAAKDSLEGDPVFVSLNGFLDLKQDEWSGTATKLLALLNTMTIRGRQRNGQGPQMP